jgi:hypothetical protein
MFAYWCDGAAAVVAAGGLQLLDDLAECAIPDVHRWVAVLLGGVARHPSLTATVLAAHPCEKIIALFQCVSPISIYQDTIQDIHQRCRR